MKNEKAKYILHELKSIKFYEYQIAELDRLMENISSKIIDIQTPTCPNGGDGTKIQSHISKSSIVNALLSDEQQFYEEKTHYSNCLLKAKAYYTKLVIVCDENEKEFVDAYIKGASHQALSLKYGYENTYRTMIGLIKRI